MSWSVIIILCGFSCDGLDHGGMTFVESVYQVWIMVVCAVLMAKFCRASLEPRNYLW